MDKCKKVASQWCLQLKQARLLALTLSSVACFISFANVSHANSGEWQAVGAASNGESPEGWFRTSSDQQIAAEGSDLRQSKSTERAASTGSSEITRSSTTRPGSLVPVIVEQRLPSRLTASTPSNSVGRIYDNVEPTYSNQQEHVQNTPVELQPSPFESLTQKVDLFVGEVRVMGEFDAERVAVGNGAIVKAEILDSGELLIIATSAGSTSVRLWNRDKSQTDYNIRVSESDPETRVQLQRMVRMRVRMVEFRKSALGSLGIDWSDSTTGPSFESTGATRFTSTFNTVTPLSTSFGIAANIASKINFLAQNGDAVTLAEPVLSAMNGGQASFLAGGEVPYPIVGENGQKQVEFKEYGVKLNVAPLIDDAGNVHASLETEISQLDSSVTVQGAPGLLTRRAQTDVTVRSGQTIVISGLLSSESSTDVERVPGLGRLPLIGGLFSSTNKRNTVNELVIFVTPEVIEPQQPMISTREKNYLRQSDQRVEMLRGKLPLME